MRVIDPKEYKEDLYLVQVAAFSGYPDSYRPSVSKESFVNSISNWENHYKVFGAFDKESGTLQGYSLCGEHENFIALNVQKTNPVFERKQINAALVYAILEHYKDRLTKDCPLVDGERNILHETSFEDYLEKKFGFRKAYCKLHIKYKYVFGFAVRLLYPFRGLLNKINSLKAKQACAVLRMEGIVRRQRKKHD